MKISSLGMTVGCALALAAGSAVANVGPNLQDAQGRALVLGAADGGAGLRDFPTAARTEAAIGRLRVVSARPWGRFRRCGR